MSLGPDPLDEVIQEFFGDEGDDAFSALTPDNLERGTILATNFNRARAALDLRRQRFLSDFGLTATGEVNPEMRFGAFQNTLREVGGLLDSFEGNSAARGFQGGSGLARSGANQARAFGSDRLDQLQQSRIDQLAAFGQEGLDLSEGLKLDLIDLRQQNLFDKVETELPEGVDPQGPAAAAAEPGEPASQSAKSAADKVAKAGQFARNRLMAAKRAGIKIGAIPKDPSNAAAKWRRVSARLTPAEKDRLNNQLRATKVTHKRSA